jgi:hypothetical protein
MFTICHISVTISDISLIIGIKPRTEGLIHVTAVMFYAVQTNYPTCRGKLLQHVLPYVVLRPEIKRR